MLQLTMYKKGYVPWNKGVKATEEHRTHQSLGLKGHTVSIETREKIRAKALGRPLSSEHRKSISKSLMGRPGPKISPEGIERIRQSKLGSKSHLYGKHSWNYGRHVAIHDALKKWRAAGGQPWLKGTKGLITAWNKGLKAKDHPGLAKCLDAAHKACIGHVPWNKGKAWSKETLKKIFTRRPMSSLEIKTQSVIEKYKLPYRFVGHGDFVIEGKNPDFINTNGKKVAVEIYAKRHKEEVSGYNLKEWKMNRSEILKKYGWKIIYLDETQLTEDYIKSVLS